MPNDNTEIKSENESEDQELALINLPEEDMFIRISRNKSLWIQISIGRISKECNELSESETYPIVESVFVNPSKSKTLEFEKDINLDEEILYDNFQKDKDDEVVLANISLIDEKLFITISKRPDGIAVSSGRLERICDIHPEFPNMTELLSFEGRSDLKYINEETCRII